MTLSERGQNKVKGRQTIVISLKDDFFFTDDKTTFF